MARVLQTLGVGLLLAASGCQCVRLPDLDFACERPQDCPVGTCQAGRCVATDDGGTEDAGAPDAGVSDAGTTDGGSTDAGSGDAGIPLPGVCESWACVQQGWGEPADGGATRFSVIGGVDAGVAPGTWGVLGWFGGVLLPSGQVVAIPHRAATVLLIDPSQRTTQQVGAAVAEPAERKWAGGVLGPDGVVYAAPYQAPRLLRIDVDAGTAQPWGPALGDPDAGAAGQPLFVGGVLDAFGRLWLVSENPAKADPVVVVHLDAGTVQVLSAAPASGGWWGLTRLPDDRLVAFPKEHAAGGSPYILELTPLPPPALATVRVRTDFDASDAGQSYQGGVLTRAGHVLVAPAGIPGDALRYDGQDGGLRVLPVPQVGTGFLGTHGDGHVYSTPDNNQSMLRLTDDGGVHQLTSPFGTTNDRYGWLGFVATPWGLVGIPGNRPDVLVFEPGPDESRPMRVLLSPYFNRL